MNWDCGQGQEACSCSVLCFTVIKYVHRATQEFCFLMNFLLPIFGVSQPWKVESLTSGTEEKKGEKCFVPPLGEVLALKSLASAP